MRRLVCLSSLAVLLAGAAAAQQVSITAVSNAGSLDTRFSPGTLVTIFGGAFSGQNDANTVTVGNRPAAVIGLTLPTQMTVQLPTDVPLGPASVVVNVAGDASPPFPIVIQDFAPAFYSLNGRGIFYTSSNVPITEANPATPGSSVTAYMVGLGPTTPPLATGVAATGPTPTLTPPILTIGGKVAAISYAGYALGLVGVYRVTFTVPPELPAGNQTVNLSIGSRVAIPTTLFTSAGTPGFGSITNGANFQVKDITHPAAPNSFVSIFASNIGTLDSTSNLFPATSFQGLSVAFNGKAVPLYFVLPSLGQINLVLPADLPESGVSTLTITNSVGVSQNIAVSMAPADIGAFRLTDPSNANRKNGAVLFASKAWRVMPASMATALGIGSCDGKAATAICGQPATIGDVIQIYFTGGGKATPNGIPTGPVLVTGTVAPADGSVIYKTVETPTVRIGGLNATVLFSGIAPGNAGLYQINAVIPIGSQLGDDVPVIVAAGGTQDTVTIAIK